MVEKRQTPIDSVAGMPLPIYPFSDPNKYAPMACEEDGPVLYETNWHHAFFPDDDLTANITGGPFLKQSRVQNVPVWLHDDYHSIFSGPEIPKTVKQRFLLGVFAVAGYMPKYAIDVPNSSDEDSLIRLKYSEYKRMLKPDMLKGDFVQRSVNLRRASKFMLNYIFKQDISSLDKLTAEEFLICDNKQRQLELASFIIDRLVDESTDPIKDKYHRIYRKHLIPNRQLGSPREAVLRVTNPYIPENIDKLYDAVLKAAA